MSLRRVFVLTAIGMVFAGSLVPLTVPDKALTPLGLIVKNFWRAK